MNVTQRQNLLQYLGYYEGRVDGISGPLTEAALAQFRADNGNPMGDDELNEVLIGAVFHSRMKGSAEMSEDDGDFWSTVQYFGRHEFACKCGTYCDGYPVEPSEKLVRVLDEIRHRIGEPLYTSSGIRCPQHNANVGGADDSRHMYGDAADIRAENTSSRELYDIACDIVGNTGGVGLYDGYIHVDTRGYYARW